MEIIQIKHILYLSIQLLCNEFYKNSIFICAKQPQSINDNYGLMADNNSKNLECLNLTFLAFDCYQSLSQRVFHCI